MKNIFIFPLSEMHRYALESKDLELFFFNQI